MSSQAADTRSRVGASKGGQKVKVISSHGNITVKEKRLDAPAPKPEPQPAEEDHAAKKIEQRRRDLKPRIAEGLAKYGFERLGHMYTVGFFPKFEELQGRHPFDFVEETKDHFQYHPKYLDGAPVLEDTTLLDSRLWMDPICRGQITYDYCRDKWLDRASRIGASCAPVGCLFSLLEIALSCKTHGGLTFMSIYFILTVVFGIPFIYMELTLGQYHRLGVVKTMRDACPLFQGLAFLMLFSCAMEYVLTMNRLSWLLHYFFESFRDVLPWSTCKLYWATKFCKSTKSYDDLVEPYIKGEGTPAVQYFKYIIRRIPPYEKWTFNYVVSLLPDLEMLACFGLLVLVFREVMKLRCRTLGRGMLYMFGIALIFLVFCVYLKGSSFKSNGYGEVLNFLADISSTDDLYNENVGLCSVIQFNFLANETTTLTNNAKWVVLFLQKLKAWLLAIRHTILGTGVGTGIHITFGSHNSFTNKDIKTQACITALSSYVLHAIIAFYFTSCYFLLENTLPFKRSNSTQEPYGDDVVLELLPQVAAQHPHPAQGWYKLNSIIIALILVGSMRIVCGLHVIKQHFCDKFKEFYEPSLFYYDYWEKQKGHRQKRFTYARIGAKRKANLVTKFMLCAGILPLLFFCHYGADCLFALQLFWYKYIPPFVVLVESFIAFFFLGVRTLNDYIRRMTSFRVTYWYRFLWNAIVPTVPIVYTLLFSRFFSTANLEDIEFTASVVLYIISIVRPSG